MNHQPKNILCHILSALKIKSKIFESPQNFLLAENIFGRKTYLVLNCEDWDNMFFFLSVVLGIDLSSHNFEERKIVLNRGWWGHHQCFDNLVTGSNSIRHDKLNLNEENRIYISPHKDVLRCSVFNCLPL